MQLAKGPSILWPIMSLLSILRFRQGASYDCPHANLLDGPNPNCAVAWMGRGHPDRERVKKPSFSRIKERNWACFSYCSCTERERNVYVNYLAGLQWPLLHLWVRLWASLLPLQRGVSPGEAQLQGEGLLPGALPRQPVRLLPRALLAQQVLLAGRGQWWPISLKVWLGSLQVRVQPHQHGMMLHFSTSMHQ